MKVTGRRLVGAGVGRRALALAGPTVVIDPREREGLAAPPRKTRGKRAARCLSEARGEDGALERFLKTDGDNINLPPL